MAKSTRKRGRKSGSPAQTPPADGMLTSAAKAIGTALGSLSAKAKAIKLPSLPELPALPAPPTLEEAKASIRKLRLPFRKKNRPAARRRRRGKNAPSSTTARKSRD
jgi:hypothetical protein